MLHTGWCASNALSILITSGLYVRKERTDYSRCLSCLFLVSYVSNDEFMCFHVGKSLGLPGVPVKFVDNSTHLGFWWGALFPSLHLCVEAAMGCRRLLEVLLGGRGCRKYEREKERNAA